MIYDDQVFRLQYLIRLKAYYGGHKTIKMSIGLPFRMASSGAIALWCQTVMSRVHGNTINTTARMSLLFGISRIGLMPRHYLQKKKHRRRNLKE